MTACYQCFLLLFNIEANTMKAVFTDDSTIEHHFTATKNNCNHDSAVCLFLARPFTTCCYINSLEIEQHLGLKM